MTLSHTVERVGWTLAIVVVAALFVGPALGQPVPLGYVETESMAPALHPGDGFVALPDELTPAPAPGDVVVFRAERLHGGGLVTHRVVAVTDDGYVTRGDANAFTDQDGGEPLVADPQVVARVVTVGGDPVRIPRLGTAVEGTRAVVLQTQHTLARTTGLDVFRGRNGLVYLLGLFAAALYVLDAVRGDETRRGRERTRPTPLDPRLLLVAFVGLVVVGATASMVLPAGVQTYQGVSAAIDVPGPRVIPAGTTEEVTYPVANGGVVPVVVFLEPVGDGIDVTDRELRVPPRTRVNATVSLTVPQRLGPYRHYLVEHRYLAVLPTPVIRDLHAIHPWLPVVVIDALLALAFLLVTLPFVGTAPIRGRSRRRDGSRRPSGTLRHLFR